MPEARELRLRRDPRAFLDGGVELEVDGGATKAAVLCDLSRSGAGLATAEPLPPGTAVTLSLPLPQGPLRLPGVVVWSRPARPDRPDRVNAGVRFDGPGGAELAALERAVEAQPGPALEARAAAPESERSPSHGSEAPPLRATEAAPAAEGGDTAPVEVVPEESGESRTNTSRARLLPVLLVLAVGLLVALGWWRLQAGSGSAVTHGATAVQAPTVAGGEEPAGVEERETPSALPEVEDGSSGDEEAAAAEAEAVSAGEQASAPVAAAETGVNAPPAPAEQTSASPAAPPAAGPLAALAIEVKSTGGTAWVEVRLDGPVARSDVFSALLGVDPPRYLLRLSRVTSSAAPRQVAVASGAVVRVRSALHDTERGPELHVVVDLTDRDVETSLEVEGAVVRVGIARRAVAAEQNGG